MSTEQLREEFERWLISTGESADSQNGIYLSPIANISWAAWRASRALMVVKLPEKVSQQNTDSNGYVLPVAESYDEAIDDCADAIRAAGITVKE